MIRVVNLEKSFKGRALFDKAAMSLISGERLALFGRNGSGKSTFLKILTGEEHQDNGDIFLPKDYKIGHLKQHLEFKHKTVLEEVCSVLGEYWEAESYKGEIILEGLGFDSAQLEIDPQKLSGGFQIRINLAKLILSEPNLLLLDEPTNYLDIVSLRWLEEFLRTWPNELIVISHDKSFCDAVSTSSALIYRGQFKKVPGNSTKLYETVALDEEVYERTRANQDRQRKHLESFITRFRAQASKATLVQSRVKALERMGEMSELSEEATLGFSFTSAPYTGRFPLEVSDLSFAYPDDPGNKLISDLSFTVKKQDRVAVIGKNGRGKSTLLKLLSGNLAPTSGIVNLSANTKLSLFGQTNVNRLNMSNTIAEEIGQTNPNLDRTKVRNICGAMMFEGDDGLKKISVLSGGEKSRVLLGKILATPSNLLLLDEPTNHLDVESVEALLDAIERFDGTVVIVTHNEDILKRFAERLVVFQGDKPWVFEGTYEEFLDSVGWDGEENSGGKKKNKSPNNLDQNRKERAANVQERSELLAPVKKKIAELEKEISKLEKDIKLKEDDLVRASQAGKVSEITDISKNLGDVKKELEKKISLWEESEKELEELAG